MNGLIPQNNDASANGNRALVRSAEPESLAAASAGKLTPEQQVVMARVQHKAGVIRNLAFPAAMATAIPVAQDIGAGAFKVYRDGLLREAGSPTDPVEVMLVEQISLAHHRVAQLHAQAEQSKTIEGAKVYSTAATRLTGEVRRLALALKQYREPSGKKQFTVVRQQNVSAGGQQVAYLDQGGPPQGQIPFNSAGSEQGSRRLAYAPQTAFIPESQAASSRPAEPAFARPTDAGGARAAAIVGPPEPTMEVLDGATNRGGQGPVGSERSLAAER